MQKPEQPIPLHRVAVVSSFARFLGDVGSPVERLFRRVGLPWCALENEDNYVPSQRFWNFLVIAAHSEGIEDLGYRVGRRFGADSVDPHLTDALQRAATLYRGVVDASRLINQTISHCHVGILQPSDSNRAYLYHRPSCRTDNPAIQQIGWFGIATLLGMVHVYTGKQWQPAEIGLITDHRPCRSILNQFPRAHIRLSRPFTYITLENELLSLPPLSRGQMEPPNRVEPLPVDYVDSLEAALLSYVQEANPNLQLAASLCNVSTRTLQRKLSERGTNYTEVLARARFRAACRMLQNPGMKVTDIAYRLGYDNVSHFTRGFRRIAGVTPTVYRRN